VPRKQVPEQLRIALVEALRADVPDLDPEWRAAFADVPREVFVPTWYTPRPDRPGWRRITASDPDWLTGVYSPAALITQVGGAPDDEARAGAESPDAQGAATSSSSAPALMASMLQALQVRPGSSVLEIGTGTGYNAALLCHRLGEGSVSSVDVDEHLVTTARARLATLGHRPHLHARDGLLGWPARGPFDRVLATVAVPRIPSAWLEQTTPGGRLVVPLDLAGRGGLIAALDLVEPGVARGRFLPNYGGFMSVRAHQHHAHHVLAGVQDEDGDVRETALSAAAATDARHPFEFLAGLAVGGYDWLGLTPDAGGAPETWLAGRNGSWACHRTDAAGRHTVQQGGPVRLWDRIEVCHAEWITWGRPSRERFGLTVAADTEHTLWLDAPASGHRWPLDSLVADAARGSG
jgi:methyltransferase of ATP-grasp peptide maturase system